MNKTILTKKKKVIDRFGNLLRFESVKTHLLSTDKENLIAKKQGKTPVAKLEKIENFFVDEMGRNFSQISIVNPQEDSIILEYDEFYSFDETGKTEYQESLVVPYEDFFVVNIYIATQEMGKNPNGKVLTKLFDYSGKELDVGKIKFKRGDSFEKEVKTKLEEQNLSK